MLNLRYTRIFMSEQREVVSSVVVQEEGMAMVFVKENGITKVQPSTGAAGEIFAGISLARNVPPGWMPMIEEFLVDASLSRMLLRAPLTGQILIKVGGATKTVVVGAPANNGQVGLTGQVLSFFAGEAAKSVVVQYLYEPTTVEAATFVGQAIIGGLAFQTMSSVGVITRGDICTNYYDASVDWSTIINGVRLGANGKFTTTGTGTVLTSALVMNSPNVDNPMLTIRLSSD